MENNNFLEIAKRRFPTQVVGGSGRWALYTPAAGPLGKVLLFDNRGEAVAQILDPKRVQIVDLLEKPASKLSGDEILARIPDRYYERERRE